MMIIDGDSWEYDWKKKREICWNLLGNMDHGIGSLVYKLSMAMIPPNYLLIHELDGLSKYRAWDSI